MEYGIVAFELDTKPEERTPVHEFVRVLGMYGPYQSKEEAEGFVGYVSHKHREIFDARYESGRYEFHYKVESLQTSPPNSDGFL
jgi:hypothetical protein